jgi:hypothetical protein
MRIVRPFKNPHPQAGGSATTPSGQRIKSSKSKKDKKCAIL